MKDDVGVIAVALFFIALIAIGFGNIGYQIAIRHMQSEAVDRGFAGYDQKTGKWCWNESGEVAKEAGDESK